MPCTLQSDKNRHGQLAFCMEEEVGDEVTVDMDLSVRTTLPEG